MDPVGNHGQVIMDYSLYDARRAGFETAVFIIKREMENDFRHLIGDRIARVMEVRYAFQELSDLPTGYTVPEGRTNLGEPVMRFWLRETASMRPLRLSMQMITTVRRR